MEKANYLKMVGTLEVIAFLILTITYIINMAVSFSVLTPLAKTLMIITFSLFVLIGPAFAIICFTVADHEIRIKKDILSDVDITPYSLSTQTHHSEPLTAEQAKQKREIINTLFTKGVISEKERDERLKQINENIQE